MISSRSSDLGASAAAARPQTSVADIANAATEDKLIFNRMDRLHNIVHSNNRAAPLRVPDRIADDRHFPKAIMTKYVLISFKTCPWVQRAAIVLREKKIDFEFRHIEPDNRPDWFLKISPHKKVPLLQIDDTIVLFESNAIAEYLDETIAPRLHPEDPVLRAVNRAWNDFIPTFGPALSGIIVADTKEEYEKGLEKIPPLFERLEAALAHQGDGPFFNGPDFALVDAGYAPFLQRHLMVERMLPSGLIDRYPRLKAWAEALEKHPTVHSFPPAEFEAQFRGLLKGRNKFVAQSIKDAPIS